VNLQQENLEAMVYRTCPDSTEIFSIGKTSPQYMQLARSAGLEPTTF
jgi:hypothetical protein